MSTSSTLPNWTIDWWHAPTLTLCPSPQNLPHRNTITTLPSSCTTTPSLRPTPPTPDPHPRRPRAPTYTTTTSPANSFWKTAPSEPSSPPAWAATPPPPPESPASPPPTPSWEAAAPTPPPARWPYRAPPPPPPPSAVSSPPTPSWNSSVTASAPPWNTPPPDIACPLPWRNLPGLARRATTCIPAPIARPPPCDPLRRPVCRRRIQAPRTDPPEPAVPCGTG
mmetsp:Transcript_33143/g.76448  ORF Transcript_33143/g.76448 Transcript_33143/m.76448 type:complete len:223 (-) Transcript_33143:769-1437(-)